MRLRQILAQQYGSNTNINSEFENLIRYLNSAEVGGKTLTELLEQVFDEDGAVSGLVELRKNTDGSIEYRTGTYTDDTAGWTTLANLDELRGQAGVNVGEVGQPIFYGRQDAVATASQTAFDYAHDSTDEVIVYVNGVLQREGASYDYTLDPTGGTGSAGVITFNTGLTLDSLVSAFKVRATAISGYRRQETTLDANQTLILFAHTSDERLQVYLDGILQTEGASYDYVANADADQVVLTSAPGAGSVVTIITVENTAVQAVTGLMMEEAYVDSATGLIDLAKILIADGGIAQAKVSGLVSALSSKAKMSISSSTPTGASAGDLWFDTTSMDLKVYDGTQFILTSPDSAVPTFSASQSGEYLRVASDGSTLEFGALDTSNFVTLTQRNASNGYAGLDANGAMSIDNLPARAVSQSFSAYEATADNSGGGAVLTVPVATLFREKYSVDGVAVSVTGGTLTGLKVKINGTEVAGVAVDASASTPGLAEFATAVELDALTSIGTIDVEIPSNGAASVTGLRVAVSAIRVG